MSSADKALYERAKQSGNVYQTRDEAAGAFKRQYGQQYKTTFDSEPPARPNYIPPTYTSSSGQTSTVTYDSSKKGYGHWSGGGPGLGDFIIYDILTDAAMSDRVMKQKGYYYGSPPPNGSTAGFAIFVVILFVLVLGIVFFAQSRR